MTDTNTARITVANQREERGKRLTSFMLAGRLLPGDTMSFS